MASRSTLRLRRRPRAGAWQLAWQHRACRFGFVAGFLAGMAVVVGLSRSEGLASAKAVTAMPVASSTLAGR